MNTGTPIHHQECQTRNRVPDSKGHGAHGGPARQRGCNHGYCHQLHRRQKSINEIVGVVAVGVEGVTGPEPPDESEKPQIRKDPLPILHRLQPATEDSNGDYESKVVEQLEPGCSPVGLSEDRA